MGRYQHHRARRPDATDTAPAPSAIEYRATTVGLEEQVFTIGSTQDAANFELVKDELGKHFSTQSCSDGAESTITFETLTEPIR